MCKGKTVKLDLETTKLLLLARGKMLSSDPKIKSYDYNIIKIALKKYLEG